MFRKTTSFILAIFLLLSLAATFSPVKAATILPPGFVSEAVVTNLTGPTTIAFAPDGRMFIGQKDGRVRVFQNGALLPTDFIDLSAEVNTYWDRGLMGIAVHPDFPTTPYLYFLYTYDPPGSTANGTGARVSRLMRVTADPNNTNVALPGSEVVLLGTNSTLANIGDLITNDGPASCESGGVYVQDCIAADGPSHTIGTLIFGTDGSLFVSSGDAAHFNYTDFRALRALNVDSLNGKILRIHPITGEGYPDNPFYNGNPNSNRSKVYSLGLRNPFRVTVNTSNGELFIGDVGWNAWEELNTGRGKNFGWPCYEGDDVGSAQQGSYKNTPTTSATCSALYAQGLGAVQAPIHSYQNIGGASVQAGGFYQGINYPPQYQGALFFSDYDSDWINYLTFDGNGVATKFDFGTDVSPVGGVVQLLIGPDTNLYYVAYNGPSPNTSEVRRIRYTAGGNTPPIANASADPDSGYVPFTVNFSSAGSFDPDNQVLTYVWDFGDGNTDAGPNPSHTYVTNGNFTATLTVTDSAGDTGSDTVDVTVGNLRPVASIISPTDGFAYSAGDTIGYNGTGIDNDDGNLGGASLQWDILLHHNQHTHFDYIPGLIDNIGSFPVPDHGDNTWIELCLTVTDSGGLNDQDCVNLQPNMVALSFDTVPGGLKLEYDGITYTTPFVVTTNVNSVRDLIAPLTQGACNNFVSWSDGGTASHQITTGATPQTYTATYTSCPTIGANGVNSVPDTGNGSISENEGILDTLGITQLTVEFSQDVLNVPSTDPNYGDSVTNPANYMLVLGSSTGVFQTVSCSTGVVAPDVAISVDSVTYSSNNGAGPFIATLNINGGLPLNVVGFYRLYVCGTTSIVDAVNTNLILAGNGSTPGTDFLRNFRIRTRVTGGGNNGKAAQVLATSNLLIPVTGFAPGQDTPLPIQPKDKSYKSLGEIRIEIPSLGINYPIVGTLINKNGWDLTWLKDSVAYLEGSAYPTQEGNTVLTAHVLDASNNLGPFSDIKGMQSGQKIHIHANGQVHVYQVQENRKVLPTDISAAFKHEEYSWITLVTCEDYNAKTGLYTHRRMVRAVLISVISEK